MEDRQIARQRIAVVGVAVAVVLAVGAFVAFAVAMCSGPDLQARGAGREQVQEVEAVVEAEDPGRVLSAEERAFIDFLAGNVWVDALGESSVSFTESEIVVLSGGEERRVDYELLSYSAEPAAEGVAGQTATLLVRGAEKTLTVEPYEAIWSYEKGGYEGPNSDCYLTGDVFDMAYYRHVADSDFSVTVLPADLVSGTFGDKKSQLLEALTAYCQENLPTVTELTYTGEFLVDPETGAESHIFACKGASSKYLSATYEVDQKRFVVEKM